MRFFCSDLVKRMYVGFLTQVETTSLARILRSITTHKFHQIRNWLERHLRRAINKNFYKKKPTQT